MNYDYIIDEMVFSHSRTGCFYTCPFLFFQKYMLGVQRQRLNYFSSFGSLMHDVLAKYYNGQSLNRCRLEFIRRYQSDVFFLKAPTEPMKMKYFEDAVRYLRNPSVQFDDTIVSVEQKVNFTFGGRQCVGYIDLVKEYDGGLHIFDHKSTMYKQPSGKSKKTKYDIEREDAFRQLYMYAKALSDLTGKKVIDVNLNCYRSGEIITDVVTEEKMSAYEQSFLRDIDGIRTCEYFDADPEFFKCRYICDCPCEDGKDV